MQKIIITREEEEKIIEKRKNIYDVLFDDQIKTLENKGCPLEIVKMFKYQKDKVIETAIQTDISESDIAFLPVIPKSYIGAYGLMPMIQNGEEFGYTCLDPNKLVDIVETPKVPYYIFGVDDCRSVFGESPKDAEKIITKQNRLCLIDAEIIAIGIHTDIPKLLANDRYIYATATRYKESVEWEKVVDIHLRLGKPRLDCNYLDHSYKASGAASCAARFTF
jgi:hypothetical protein